MWCRWLAYLAFTQAAFLVFFHEFAWDRLGFESRHRNALPRSDPGSLFFASLAIFRTFFPRQIDAHVGNKTPLIFSLFFSYLFLLFLCNRILGPLPVEARCRLSSPCCVAAGVLVKVRVCGLSAPTFTFVFMQSFARSCSRVARSLRRRPGAESRVPTATRKQRAARQQTEVC